MAHRSTCYLQVFIYDFQQVRREGEGKPGTATRLETGELGHLLTQAAETKVGTRPVPGFFLLLCDG